MGVYIRGMEMPRSCRQCSLYLQSMDSERNVYENCAVTAKSYNWGLTTRPSDCPLVPVPPHGDLIERDALMKEFEKAQRTMEQHGREYSCSFMSSSQEISTEWYCVEDMLDNAPTIIPAEEGE